MSYFDLSEAQLKQQIDAAQIRSAWLDAERRMIDYRGSMQWKTVKGRDYLYREYGNKRGKSQGPRSEETERIYQAFTKGKAEAAERLDTLSKSMARMRRVNVAERVGRSPNIVVQTLEAIRQAGLQDHFLVIGTNALYAYETYAGVRFDGDITATVDVDLLWDSRKHILLASDCEESFLHHGLIGLLRKIDKTFQLQNGEEYRAVNATGYMVDLIKRRPASLYDDKEKSQLVKNEDDFWAAKIVNMDWLLSSPRFRQTIVGVNGEMAEMTTVDPRAFVIYKNWLAHKDDRDPQKKPRDLKQAQAVYELLNDRLPQLDFSSIHVFPAHLRDLSDLDG
ncbi:MAG: nucleotidyltransferase domain-containing protein [Sideroxydans sp.]|nr:nucleotidyltransferase domain-containing protein [Sideroxydans sp.]